MNRSKNALDILIVGGGIHGMYIFNLIRQRHGSHLSVQIADPYPAPLHNWKHCTSNTGMKFLRSPGVHHLGVEPFSLQKFCSSHSSEAGRDFISPNSRPALDLFNKHAHKQLESYRIQDHWLQAKIQDIELSGHGAIVYTDTNRITARHVILAIGNGGQLNIPSWAHSLQEKQFPVHHIYSPDFISDSFKPGFHTVIVGGGMGAVQLFVKLAKNHAQKCTLVTPSPISTSHYDVEPGWMGPKFLYRFQQQESYQKRRQMIRTARQSGTITPDVTHDLKQVLRLSHADHIMGKVESAELFGSDSAYIKLKKGAPVFCDKIILGTGFDRVINNNFIKKLKDRQNLTCATCGYPIVDPFLRWHPNLSVMGELAELELGPAAKNIIGARHAGERIQMLAAEL